MSKTPQWQDGWEAMEAELSRTRAALKEALEGWDKASPGSWPRIVVLKKEFNL